MHLTLISRLNCPPFGVAFLVGLRLRLDVLLHIGELVKVGPNDLVQKGLSVSTLALVSLYLRVQVVLERDRKLVFETVAPVRVLGEEFHGVVEAALEEVLGHLQALQLMHGLDLLFAFGASDVEGLVLLLDAGDFAFHFLYPLVVGLLLTLVVLRLELSDFFEFGFFFDL